MYPGNANLPIGVTQPANLETGVPGFLIGPDWSPGHTSPRPIAPQYSAKNHNLQWEKAVPR